MFHVRLFPERNCRMFFSKRPHYFWPTVPISGQNKMFLLVLFLSFFLKKFGIIIIVPNFDGKVISGFQATLVSEVCMHTCMVQAHHETLHTSYHSDSKINFLVLTDKTLVVIIQCGHCYNPVS